MPLIIAFIILAAFTYTSGLRAPALIAVVKDVLIFVTVFAAVVIIPAQLGGYGAIFASVPPEKLTLPPPTGDSLGPYSAYATLALGSALALFLYPHAMTGILSSSSGNVIRRNAALLAGLFVHSRADRAARLHGDRRRRAIRIPPMRPASPNTEPNFAVPALFLASFPSWFVGVAFAAIAIGALVPAAIMSIACANLFTRNLYKEFIRARLQRRRRSAMAKIVSLVVKIGAVVFILAIPQAYAIQLQLLGGIWIIQLLPAAPARPLHARLQCASACCSAGPPALALGTYMAATQGFTSSVYPLEIFGVTVPGYAALYSVREQFSRSWPRSRRLLDLIARPWRGAGRALILAAPQPSSPRPPPQSSIGSGRDSLSSSIREEIDTWQTTTKAAGHSWLSSWAASCSLSSLLPSLCTGTKATPM